MILFKYMDIEDKVAANEQCIPTVHFTDTVCFCYPPGFGNTLCLLPVLPVKGGRLLIRK